MGLVGLGCGDDAVQGTGCWFAVPALADGRSIACGYVSVPERRQGESRGNIRIAFAQIRAAAAFGDQTPVFYLQGGPGGNIVDSAPTFAQAVAPVIAADRDLVLIDQRGVGRSEPFLACPPTNDPNASAQALIDNCRNQLTLAGVDLRAYNTQENAADIDAVRRALGYPQVTLYGSSYGSLLAQQVMRDFPDAVAGAVLDAVVPKTPSFLAELPASANGALSDLFASCAADAACTQRYGDLEATFNAVVARVQSQPTTVDLARFPEPAVTVDITAEVLVSEMLVDGLLFLGLGERAPQVIEWARDAEEDSVARRQLADVLRFLRSFGSAGGSLFSAGMFYSVVCSESGLYDATAINTADTRPAVQDIYAPRASSIPAECALWNVPPLPAEVLQPVQSAVPTLLLSGALDPRTPPRFASVVAGGLSAATNVVVAGAGHGIILASECTNSVTAQFIRAPSGALDTACVSTVAPAFTVQAPLPTAPAARQALQLRWQLR
ncbi:MAG: alpha/beta hydrolase [Polyangiales bacterium]